VTQTSTTSVSIAWNPSSDVAVTSYGTYRNGSKVADTSSTTYTFTGLACGTTYTFAVDEADVLGSRSSQSTIAATTPVCATAPPDAQAPAVPSGMRTTSITAGSVSLAWSATTDNVGVAGYNLYENGVKAGSTQSTSYSFSGLSCGTSYTLALTAYDAAGNESDPRYATTVETTSACQPAPDTQAPSAPGSLAVSSATTTSIGVKWNASSDDVGVSGYGVYRDGSSVGSTSSTSYSYSGLACGRSYTLAVDAADAAGNRSARSTITASTAACPPPNDTQPPAVPNGMRTTGITQSSVSLAWNATTDNVGVAGYNLYKDGAKVASTQSTSYTFGGLSCGSDYTLALTAYDAAGNESDGRYATTVETTSACTPAPDTQAPTAPGSFAKTTATTTSINVSWSASSDNVGVAGYTLYRNGTNVGSTTSTSYSYTGLTCNTSYTLAIDAADAAGNRSGKATITTSTAACGSADTQPPQTPANLTVTGTTASSVSLSWSAALDNVGTTGYGVYRNGSSVGSTASTSYTNSGLPCGTSYTFAVDAFDAAGNRSGKATVTASTSACPPPSGNAQVYVARNGSDSASCSASSPCASLQRAYSVANAGDVVEVAGGTYPPQTIDSGSKSSSADVVFRPAAGATVTFDCGTVSTVGGGTIGGQTCLDIAVSHITFDGGPSRSFKTQSYSVNGFSYQGRIDTERGVSDITFRNMDIGAVAVGSSQTTVSHNDLGPSVDPLNIRQASGTGNIWQDNLVHDFLIQNGGHMECVTWDGGTNITFEYNEFRSCAVFAIFAKPVDDISGKVDHNAFWNPLGITTNDDVKISLGSGASRCDVSVTNNWISEGTYYDCPGTTESQNTTHDPSQQPPSPIRP
jgi:chitodextrinase